MTNSAAENIYLPMPAVIDDIIVENPQVKTFVLRFADAAVNQSFNYAPGQFMMVSVPHYGETPISFSSTPTRPGTIHLSIRRAGKLTSSIHQLGKGAVIGLRGPYGRPFSLHDLKGRDLLFVAGGIGLAPLRSMINYCLDHDGDYSHKTILYGARTPEDLVFTRDIAAWRQRSDVSCLLTVDQAEASWHENVGVVTTLLDQTPIAVAMTTAIVCGPPIMIRFVLLQLKHMGFQDDQIITTMERHMKCGVGVCGHCFLDDKLICTDGPVFTLAQLKNMNVMEFGA